MTVRAANSELGIVLSILHDRSSLRKHKSAFDLMIALSQVNSHESRHLRAKPGTGLTGCNLVSKLESTVHLPFLKASIGNAHFWLARLVLNQALGMHVNIKLTYLHASNEALTSMLQTRQMAQALCTRLSAAVWHGGFHVRFMQAAKRPFVV